VRPERSAGLPPGSTARVVLTRVGERSGPDEDLVATEEPLEIRVVSREGDEPRGSSVAVTMRTPGHDFELAAGFLLSEGIVRSGSDIWRLARCDRAAEEEAENIVEAHLAPGVPFDPARFSRHVYTTSSCGICGKASIERLDDVDVEPPSSSLRVQAAVLHSLAERLTEAQTIFARTGGLHAAALFDESGGLLELREDIGRHNALDKLVGSRLLAGRLPIDDALAVVSGRAGFELVQKSLVAGVPLLAAVGAPSSLAVEAARAYGLTLVGFLGAKRFNVYSGADRILEA
jgi:FdhD protein